MGNALTLNFDLVEEEYMNEQHLSYFRQRLLDWRAELVAASLMAFAELKEEQLRKPDPVDCGTLQAAKERSLSATKRQELLVAKIDHALRRISQGTYGYCEMTGERIGLRRLAVLPLANLSIDAQERLERGAQVFRG
jgi:DnaK suppressor protein